MNKINIYFVGADSKSVTVHENATLNGQSFPAPEDFCRAVLEAAETKNCVRIDSGDQCLFVNPKMIAYIKPNLESAKLNTFIG